MNGVTVFAGQQLQMLEEEILEQDNKTMKQILQKKKIKSQGEKKDYRGSFDTIDLDGTWLQVVVLFM